MPFFNNYTFNQLYRQTWPMLIGLFAIMGSQLANSAFIGNTTKI